MLSEEEKKAMERLNKRYEFFKENPLATNVWLTLDIHNLGILLNLIEKQQKEINKLKQENHNLKQELKVYIPRRRVRRVYKMIGKILKQDGVTDDVDELLEE